jgi:nitric oxide synthase-interacting protein
VFCKECIYERLLAQKKEIDQNIQKWQEHERKLKEDELRKQVEKVEKEIQTFDKLESGILVPTSQMVPPKPPEEKQHEVGKTPTPVGSYWIPSLAPGGKEEVVKKPNKFTTCPEGNHPLRLKQLFALEFKPNKSFSDKDPKSGRYECWVCCKTLNNATKSVALSKCGHVICKGCADTIKKDGTCPQCNKKFKEKNMIKIEAGLHTFNFFFSSQVSSSNVQQERAMRRALEPN